MYAYYVTCDRIWEKRPNVGTFKIGDTGNIG